MNAAPDDEFPEDYNRRIDKVCNEAARELRSCPGDLLAQLKVCCCYFESGEQQGISHGELVDFLGVSSPSVFDKAGYTAQEAERVMKSLVLLTYDKDGKPKPPISLPETSSPPSPEQTRFEF